jgi:protein-tyrosine phosphatase
MSSGTDRLDNYRILMVCTGNICRSPVMERLLQAKLTAGLAPADRARFDISSAGTWAMVDAPMAPEAAETLESLGGDPSGFVSRDLDVEMIKGSDLILTATREHRGLVVGAEPKAASRTVTLREFARLLGPVTADDLAATSPAGDDVVARMRAVAAAALANRGLVPIDDPAADDIADPYKRDRTAYVRAANEIAVSLDVPLALLFGE